MPPTSIWSVTVVVLDHSNLDRQLNAAIDLAKAEAKHEGRCGILVIRQSPGTFTIELSDDVPYGVTKEHYAS